MDTQLIDSTITRNSIKKLNVRCQSDKYKPVKEPPEKYIKSLQLDLFSQFVTNNKKGVSNTVEIWESIPKYFLTPAQVTKLRTKAGHADPYKFEYMYEGVSCLVKIQPALIEQPNETYKAFFPGVTEELVEEALKKFLTIQNHGIHDPDKAETWVRFSLSMLHRELKSIGRTRSRDEIKHAIQVMNKCHISLFRNNKEIWSGSLLQDLVTVGREEYIENTDSLHVCRLPLFISHAINQLGYRQFNYNRLMSCNEQLTRWIYKKLINRYRQANILNNYHFLYTDLKSSGLLQRETERKNRQKVLSALNELVEKNIVAKYETDQRKTGRTITNVKYTIYPSQEFISEQKAANKRSYQSEKISGNLFVNKTL
ncbi:hypothetical protein SAMN05216302_10492 [Nitrosomonas aestuarii]|uniref:Initiator Replication protein n=1 Tax=Nitrosomonas aestuarii TaxID=52441 RepID=A0A1I4G6P9_9PROT|nr:hypothetical protein [Nitrosomonas aestuarii]SFL25758.1 hypothetical protein SAMN05216302_10492 [Nitrosomonas aestuarii]